MKYKLMLLVAFIMAILSSTLTALGMTNLFGAAGLGILILFVTIDLGRFLLFNFVVDEWNNLRKIKYLVTVIIGILFIYSAIGIYAKLDSLISTETKQAMVNAASLNKAADNAELKQTRSNDLATIAQTEYENALKWNETDYINCLNRAKTAKNKLTAENNCNNTKRRLDKKALQDLQTALTQANETLSLTEQTTQLKSQNQSEIASILSTICKLTQKSCTTYDDLQNSLTVLILLIIIGTDFLQIAIILAVNTRKNKLDTQTDIPLNYENFVLQPIQNEKIITKIEKNIPEEKIQENIPSVQPVIIEKKEEEKTSIKAQNLTVQQPSSKNIITPKPATRFFNFSAKPKAKSNKIPPKN